MPAKYYKFLDEDNESPTTNFDYTSWLPKDGEPGEWLPEIEGAIEVCQNGYHATDAMHLFDWAEANLFEVELDGDIVVSDNKSAARRLRFIRKIDAWNEKNLRLFACWCVRQIWHLVTDENSRNSVEVAERYANGEATEEELQAAWAAARVAARDAAWDAACAAAWAAACAAAWAAARDAARDAAWAAACAAAWAAARDAAWAAARDAQTKRLIEVLGLEVENAR